MRWIVTCMVSRLSMLCLIRDRSFAEVIIVPMNKVSVMRQLAQIQSLVHAISKDANDHLKSDYHASNIG